MAAERRAGGTARALQRARRRTKPLPGSSGRRPRGPGPAPRRAQQLGYVRSLAVRAARKAVPVTPLRSRRGAPLISSAEIKVTSTASCAPPQSGSPLAMTSIRRSSRRSTSTLRSCMSTSQATVAPAARHTRAVARSRGTFRGRSTFERGHAARWSPRTSSGRRQRQVAAASGSGKWSRRKSRTCMDEGSRRNAAAVGRATKTRDAKRPAWDSRSAAQRASRVASNVSAAWSSTARDAARCHPRPSPGSKSSASPSAAGGCARHNCAKGGAGNPCSARLCAAACKARGLRSGQAGEPRRARISASDGGQGIRP